MILSCARSARSSLELVVQHLVRHLGIANLDAGKAGLHGRRTFPAVERESSRQVIAVVQTHEGTHDSLRPQSGKTRSHKHHVACTGLQIQVELGGLEGADVLSNVNTNKLDVLELVDRLTRGRNSQSTRVLIITQVLEEDCVTVFDNPTPIIMAMSMLTELDEPPQNSVTRAEEGGAMVIVSY